MSDRKEQGKEASRRRDSMWLYLAHFGLHENPFAIDAESKYHWLGEKRKKALESLVRRILSGEGVQIVIGNPGTGKTLLANGVLDELGDRVLAAVVPYAEYKGIDFLKRVERAYGIGGDSQNQGSFSSRFSGLLHRSFSSGKKVVLIVDDAHRIISPYLNQLSELSRVEESGTPLFSLVFFGDSRLVDILNDEANPQLSKRVIIYTLDPLTKKETFQYIQHHLQLAQCERDLFEQGAIEEIFAYSQGVPGLINMACGAALSRAYDLGESLVLPDTVKDALNLMPAEKTVLPGNIPDRSLGMGAAAERERDEDTDEEDEEDQEDEPYIPTGEVRKRSSNRIACAILGAVIVASVGVAFMFTKSSEQRFTPSVTEKKMEVPQVSSSVWRTVAPPEATNRAAEMPSRQQTPELTAEEKARKGVEVRPERKKTQETAASRPSAAKARQPAVVSPSWEAVPAKRGTPGGDAGPDTSSDRERTVTERVESGEVIDRLLRKR